MRSTRPEFSEAAGLWPCPLDLSSRRCSPRRRAPKLDPGVAERKYYVAGLGDIKEQTVSGNHEQIQLVSVTH